MSDVALAGTLRKSSSERSNGHRPEREWEESKPEEYPGTYPERISPLEHPGVEQPARYTSTIRDLPQGERPRERLREYGSASLSEAELLAVLLRTGMKGQNVVDLARRLLKEFGGLAGMARTSYAELCQVKGISDAKACQLLSALEVGRRFRSLTPEDHAKINCPQDVFNLLEGEMSFLDQESLRVLLLNTKNAVVGKEEIYKGSVNSAAVRVAEVLRPAIRKNCPNIIMVHNHPSGDPTPSPQDVLVTRRIRASAETMDIELLDHIVIGGRAWASLKERGLGF